MYIVIHIYVDIFTIRDFTYNYLHIIKGIICKKYSSIK